MKKSMLQRVPATSQNKSLLQIDAAVEEWHSAEAGKSFWFYRQVMNPRLLLTGYWFPRRNRRTHAAVLRRYARG